METLSDEWATVLHSVEVTAAPQAEAMELLLLSLSGEEPANADGKKTAAQEHAKQRASKYYRCVYN